ncbi:MAG: AgmX/PglI C-terminal domain-containing protein [Chitinivibrionales bacterium]|nr:AgmX/PglI C-terminal domain-containing protein [Chitinivibrionales bacterium]
MAASNQTGIFFATASNSLSVKGFPRECRRSILSRFDPHFSAILGGLLVLSFGSMWFLSHRRYSEVISDQQIMQIQERYASLVLSQPAPAKPEPLPPKEENTAAATAAQTAAAGAATKESAGKVSVDREKETYAEKQVRKESTRQERQAERAAVAAQVQTSGIFAAITAASSSGGPGGVKAGNEGVSDLLGASEGGIADLSSAKISKGVFAAVKKAEGSGPLAARQGTRTAEVTIQKQAIRQAAGAQIASAASVNISSEAPQVTGNEDNASPERSQASIGRVVAREKTRLIRVYENWLKRDPALHGQIRVKFSIQPDGSVGNVSIVKSSTNNAEFDQIIVQYIGRWMFPPVAGAGKAVDVEVPFAFEGHE